MAPAYKPTTFVGTTKQTKRFLAAQPTVCVGKNGLQGTQKGKEFL
tara:strand:+ start:2019 stop:2153 length:135 start_codon:yes stop_codon:yes gene_type:complete